MSSEQDQARLIAERVARRVAGERSAPASIPSPPSKNGAPVREELSAIRDGLQDLENKLERIESKLVTGPARSPGDTRARIIDFVAAGPPLRSTPSIAQSAEPKSSDQFSFKPPAEFFQFGPASQSPWLGRLPG